MAEVYLARSYGIEGFEKNLVIKRIRPGLADSPQLVGLFVQEAKITAGLDHPNVVQIYELGRADSTPYIAMEYIRGRTLSQIRKQLGGPMDVDLAVWTVASALRGLAYAHTLCDAQGRPLHLVHRDVSPHNIIVGFQGEVKVLDFGIARIVGEEPAEGRRPDRDGNPGAGKIAYMSPEQAEGLSIDHRSDIYSAGVVLLEMLLGRRVFEDPDPKDKLRRVREADIPDPRDENPEVPAALWGLMRDMLRRDRGERPAGADLVHEDLGAFLYSRSARVGPSALGELMARLYPEAASRRPGIHGGLEDLAHDLGRLGRNEQTASQRSALSTQAPTGSDLSSSGMAPGERKSVVVLAMDLAGWERISGELEPEDLGRLAFRLLRRLRRIIDRYGGQLTRWSDGQLLAVFGLRRTHEHDLRRALGCARRLVAAVAATPWSVVLCVGVHQGEMTVGGKRRHGRVAMAHGNTVRHAWRLSAAAAEGEIRVSDVVRRSAGDRYGFSEGQPIQSRGGEALATWCLDGHRSGIDQTDERWLIRGDELDLISEALGALAAGEGRVLAIEGEAGTGKTHLLRELQRRAARRRVPLFSGHAQPFEGERPLAAFRELILGVLGLAPTASIRERRVALGSLAELGLGREHRRVLGELFGGRRDRRLRRGLEDERQALVALVRALASTRPFILAFEDVQYLQGAELALLGDVVSDTRGLPVLVLVSSRAASPASLAPFDATIRLGRLADGAVIDLVAEQLGSVGVGPDLAARVIERSEGNAFYVRALVRHLVEAGRIEMGGALPELTGTGPVPLPLGLQALIGSRVDALAPLARGALQLAAVLGPSFDAQLQREAAERLGLQAGVDELVSQRLIEIRSDGVGAFASPMVWEVSSRGMAARRRQILHRAVAESLRASDAADGNRGELARHLAGAGQLLAAGSEGEQEGDRLRAAQLLEPAAAMWEQAVSWIEGAQGSGRLRLEARLRRKAGEARALTGELGAAERHLLVALEIVGDFMDPEAEARCQLELGRLYRSRGKTMLAGVHLEAALECCGEEITQISVETNTGWRREVAVGAHEGLGMLALDAQDSGRAADQLEAARRRAGDDAALAARALLGVAALRIRLGELDKALRILQSALVHARVVGDRIQAGKAINNIGIVRHGQGRYREALEHFRSSLELRRGLGYQRGVAINYHNIAESHFRLGDLARAGAAFERSLTLARELGWSDGIALNEVYIAFLELERSANVDRDTALQRLREAVQSAEGLADPSARLSARWLLGRALVEAGAIDEARGLGEQGLREAEGVGYRGLGRDFTALLAALDGDGSPPEATTAQG